jgi:UDP-N-acetylglucosamine acyltransferase
VGLQRRGFSPERVRKIQRAFRLLLASKLNTSQAIERLRSDGDLGEDVEGLIQFIKESERGVLK